MGIDGEDLTNPWHAAFWSAISFLAGAALPPVVDLPRPHEHGCSNSRHRYLGRSCHHRLRLRPPRRHEHWAFRAPPRHRWCTGPGRHLWHRRRFRRGRRLGRKEPPDATSTHRRPSPMGQNRKPHLPPNAGSGTLRLARKVLAGFTQRCARPRPAAPGPQPR